MATVKKAEKVMTTKTRDARVSDFSGIEIPNLHWSAVTNIWCMTSDHGGTDGNKRTVFNFDLMPEEMDAFCKDLHGLIQTHITRAKARLVRK